MDMLETLDKMAEAIAKDRPDLSEYQVAFSTIRYNLTALALELSKVGVAGGSLDNESLYGLTSGIVDTAQWMLSKEMLTDAMEDINKELGENS